MMKHTKTPWHVDDMGEYANCLNISGDGWVAAAAWGGGPEGMMEANAARIVKCVNAHDELVGVLSALMSRLDQHFGGPDSSGDWIEQERARTALEKARA